MDELAALYAERQKELEEITESLIEGIAAAILLFDTSFAEYLEGVEDTEAYRTDVNNGVIENLIYAAGIDIVVDFAVNTIVETAGTLAEALELGGLSNLLDGVDIVNIADTMISGTARRVVQDKAAEATSKGLARVLDRQVNRLPIDPITAAQRTELDTVVQAVDRAVVAEVENRADRPVVYLYVGVLDSVTRPSCSAAVDIVFTREQLNQMDNGQINPVFIYLGGYNCRHGLAAMLASVARRQGLKFATDKTIADFNNAGRRKTKGKKGKR